MATIRRMLRIGWSKAEATLVAHNKVRSYWQNRDGGPSYKVQIWDHMVELPGPDGEPTRLVIRVKGEHGLELPELGAVVPVLVNRRRTKAGFDLDDPRISRSARRKIGEQRQKEKQAQKREKFESKLDERD